MFQKSWFQGQWFDPQWWPELGGFIGGKGKGAGGKHLHASLLKAEMIKRLHEVPVPRRLKLTHPVNRLLVESVARGVRQGEAELEVRQAASRAVWSTIMAEA